MDFETFAQAVDRCPLYSISGSWHARNSAVDSILRKPRLGVIFGTVFDKREANLQVGLLDLIAWKPHADFGVRGHYHVVSWTTLNQRSLDATAA
jgi:hypothetical protein